MVEKEKLFCRNDWEAAIDKVKAGKERREWREEDVDFVGAPNALCPRGSKNGKRIGREASKGGNICKGKRSLCLLVQTLSKPLSLARINAQGDIGQDTSRHKDTLLSTLPPSTPINQPSFPPSLSVFHSTPTLRRCFVASFSRLSINGDSISRDKFSVRIFLSSSFLFREENRTLYT